MKVQHFILLVTVLGLCTGPVLTAQDLSGRWEGNLLQQDGDGPAFRYHIEIDRKGDAVSGFARSESGDPDIGGATFSLSGKWDGSRLLLQEVEQLSPDLPKWCLKYMQLSYREEAGEVILEGPWTAKGCSPGTLKLRHVGGWTGKTRQEELPFDTLGRWSGQLSQTDREYGFHYTVTLQKGGYGTSHIVSEDNGGEATHRLRWWRIGQEVFFEEDAVIEKTDPQWPWCIKKGRLQLQRERGVYRLTGTWQGFIEGKNPATALCAPGEIYLEKPVLTRAVRDTLERRISPYENLTQRKVRVDRSLQVTQDRIRIRVWDNGTVDGDVVTLFLNGEKILENFRVSKRKWTIPVEILNGENLLIMHADDLGDIVPNTVAVAIDDGTTEQVIILSSNLRESGAILIQPFTLD